MEKNLNPKVSIIIPVCNGSNYLKEAIDSALGQTYKNIEVIVVNDGSDDNGATRDIALKYAEKIIYIEKENGGVASALNIGIKKMSGDFFSWLSHDDVYYENKIKAQMKAYAESKDRDVLIWSDYDIIDESGEMVNSFTLFDKNKKGDFFLLFATYINGCSLLVPKTAFDIAGLFDENLLTVQDNHMWARMIKSGFSFMHVPKKLIASRVHSEQTQKVLNNLHKQEVLFFYRFILCECGYKNEMELDELDMLCKRKSIKLDELGVL
jgi:glycosyltransferase involved in cell wall biosynthesis